MHLLADASFKLPAHFTITACLSSRTGIFSVDLQLPWLMYFCAGFCLMIPVSIEMLGLEKDLFRAQLHDSAMSDASLCESFLAVASIIELLTCLSSIVLSPGAPLLKVDPSGVEYCGVLLSFSYFFLALPQFPIDRLSVNLDFVVCI